MQPWKIPATVVINGLYVNNSLDIVPVSLEHPLNVPANTAHFVLAINNVGGMAPTKLLQFLKTL